MRVLVSFSPCILCLSPLLREAINNSRDRRCMFPCSGPCTSVTARTIYHPPKTFRVCDTASVKQQQQQRHQISRARPQPQHNLPATSSRKRKQQTRSEADDKCSLLAARAEHGQLAARHTCVRHRPSFRGAAAASTNGSDALSRQPVAQPT